MGNNLIKCFIFAFICVLTASCASLNKNVHTQTDNAIHAKFSQITESEAIKALGEGVMKWRSDSLALSQKISIRLYDTQTMDLDGTHPLLAEIEIATEQEQKIETLEKDTTSWTERETQNISTDAQLSDTTHTESKEAIKKKPKTAQTFWSLSAFGLVAIIIFLIYRKQ